MTQIQLGLRLLSSTPYCLHQRLVIKKSSTVNRIFLNLNFVSMTKLNIIKGDRVKHPNMVRQLMFDVKGGNIVESCAIDNDARFAPLDQFFICGISTAIAFYVYSTNTVITTTAVILRGIISTTVRVAAHVFLQYLEPGHAMTGICRY